MKIAMFILALVLCVPGPAGAILTISIDQELALPGTEIWLNRGDEAVLEVTGDASTSVPLEGFFYVEGPGSIRGHTMAYAGTGSEYCDLEELALAAGITSEETLAEYRTSTGRNLSDMSKWVLKDSQNPERPLTGVLMANIMFKCEGEGDVLLTLETDDEWTTYPNYTIIIHQAAVTNTYHVDANTGCDNNSGLSSSEAFATIQKAIDSAYDGETIMVQPGRYLGDVSFSGKNIIVRSIDPNDSAIVEQTVIGGDFGLGEPESIITFSGDEEPGCRLWGFNIKGYIRGNDGVSNNYTHATISQCLLCNSMGNCSNVIGCCDGLIENCIIAGNNMYLCSIFGAAVGSCNGTIRNCTFANNMTDYAVSVGNGGTTKIENCIMYDSYVLILSGGFADISYTNLRGYAFEIDAGAIAKCNINDSDCVFKCDGVALGPGIIFEDPCFVRVGDGSMGIVGDYHLKSQVGRWDCASSRWVIDNITSRCIDAGNPGSPLGGEPCSPLNKRLNMGAYGGTAEAGKTPLSWSRLADLTNDGIVDGEDFACLTKDRYSTRPKKPGDLNRNGAVLMDDLQVLVGEWLKTTMWH